MRHGNITDTCPIENRVCVEKFKKSKMAKSISKINSVKASTEKLLGKPPPGDKTLGIEPDIRFYEIEDSDNTVEV